MKKKFGMFIPVNARHQAHVLLVDLGDRAAAGRRRWPTVPRALAAAVARNVAGAAARRADDVVRNVRLVRAEPALVLVRAAVVAARPVRLAQRAVQLGQLAQLHPAQVVVALRHLDALPDHVLDAVDRLLHRLRIARGDERVQRLVLARQRLPVLAPHLTLLYRALAADDDLGARVLLHRLQRVAARPDQQPDEVDIGVLLLRDEHLVADANHWRSVGKAKVAFMSCLLHHPLHRNHLLVVRRRLKVRIERLHALDELVALLLQLLARAELARVQPLAVAAVNRFGRRGPVVCHGGGRFVVQKKVVQKKKTKHKEQQTFINAAFGWMRGEAKVWRTRHTTIDTSATRKMQKK